MIKKPIKPPSTTPKPKSKKYLLIPMASLLCLSFLSLLLYFSLSSASHHHHTHPSPSPPLIPSQDTTPPQIQQACKATRFPQTCESSLTRSGSVPPDPNSLQIIGSAMGISTQNLETAKEMVQNILDSSSGNPNRSTAARSCLEVLHNSGYRIGLANDALPRGKVKDSRAWLSAALLYQYDCWSGLKYVNDTQMVNKTMSFMDSLIGLTSNALSMLVSYDRYGNDTVSWKPPLTERDGFWEDSGSGQESWSGFGGVVPTDLPADAMVCKSGRGCYSTLQEAVNEAPDNSDGRFVIRIMEGVYEETVRVPLEKRNVVFLGDGMGKTIITGSLNVGITGVTTYTSATVGVLGDGFMASGLTIQNTAGPDAHQAVAFRSDSDHSIIENCEFIGNQDTLYAHSLRQFYKSCTVQGNVDFIFGNSASLFLDCIILVAPRQLKPEKGENNAITAQGRTDPAQSTGFVFQNCLINGTQDYMALYYSKPSVHRNYLGRPWKEYSRTVFMNCNLEVLISPPGWMPWSGDFALKTLYYGEYGNTGAGANTSQRVSWSSKVPGSHVSAYSVKNFIQGEEWISTKS
ncbi:Pectinesterase, catalytic [Dillenia turbinata]|uniref:pectinesterase n=1 Tax=Dillenia turbinata TaxID=194707 RepID=A0AAN8Z2N6_9MAGN